MDRPSTRYRLLQYIPYINSSGIETDVVVIPGRIKRWNILRWVNRYDGVFIQKKLFSRPEQWYLRKKAKRIVYDFDDAIMYTNLKFSSHTRRYKRFGYMMDIADLLIAGNRYLAGFVGDRCRDKAIIVPTVVDVARYPLHTRNNSGATIGWIGTKSTQVYLDMIEPALKKLITKYPQVQVKIVSDKMPGFCGSGIIWEEWGVDKELELFKGFDIGIMPLKEDTWTKGKCGFKIIQYMATGIPVVCSPVGMNTEIVRDGVNGFFASNLEEWETAISRLIEDADLYKRMAIAARQTVEKNYNLASWGPYLANLIKEELC